MSPTSRDYTIPLIDNLVLSPPLAEDLYASIVAGLSSAAFLSVGGDSVWGLFKRSYDHAVRDIENHPRGLLFKRLIEFGPLLHTEPEDQAVNGQTHLSDPEWGECVEFIFSHMINRFKGELAELLAIKPCLELMDSLTEKGRLPQGVRFYWGDSVQEYRRRKLGQDGSGRVLAKGADGLLMAHGDATDEFTVRVHGIVEIKSMAVSKRKLAAQLERHKQRLAEGVRLAGVDYTTVQVDLNQLEMIRIMVVPSTWRLSREFRMEETEPGVTAMVFPEPQKPDMGDAVAEVEPKLFRITLGWSKEALEQAAYEMTYRYMALVGESVFFTAENTDRRQGMEPAEAGYNAIKQALYMMPLRGRYNPKRKTKLAVRLYNVYSFGYPLGIDGKEMLWPEDLPGLSA
jgi:hypothetical protein